MWTRFYDMHSGGGAKEKWELIFIEAPEDEAISIFYNRFGHNPNRVSCTCCGADYSIYEDGDSLERQDFKDKKTLVIYTDDIKDNERNMSVPEQGYVWKG